MTADATERGAVYAPEYGPVRRVIEYGLFYFVVDRCTRLLAALFAELPQFASHVPTLKTASAGALWAMLALVVVLEARRQYEANPWEVPDLAALRPSPRRSIVAGGASVLGAGAVVVGWSTVARLTGDVTVAMAVGQEVVGYATSAADPLAEARSILGTDLGVVVAFSAGFVLLTYGLDRLLVGLIREALYRRYAPLSERSGGGDDPTPEA